MTKDGELHGLIREGKRTTGKPCIPKPSDKLFFAGAYQQIPRL